MSRKPHYVYIAGYLKETVTDSQIINWLQLYEEQGVVFDLLLLAGIKPYFKDKKLRKSKIKEARKKISGKIYQIYSIKPTTVFGQTIIFTGLFVLFLKDILLRRTLIIQTRTSSNLRALKWLKTIYSKLAIVFDTRGAVAEEYLLTEAKLKGHSNSNNHHHYVKIIRRELDFIWVADKVFTVSNRLKTYYLEKDSRISEDKIIVIPGCADQNMFFWNNHARNRVRDNLGINDRIVLVYAGGLDQTWQIPERLFYIFSKLSEHNPQLFFMCITANKDIVQTYVRKFNIRNENIWIDYVKNDSINDYLCAADIGLLFRENTPTNNVASPTKFAEYVMAGLPVIISEGVGDFSAFVKKFKIGLVIKNDSYSLEKEITKYLINLNVDREKIAALCKKEFSKQRYLARSINAYKDILINMI